MFGNGSVFNHVLHCVVRVVSGQTRPCLRIYLFQIFIKQRPMAMGKQRLLSFSTNKTDFFLFRELLGPNSDVTGNLFPLQLPPFGKLIDPTVTSKCSSTGIVSLELSTLVISDITVSALSFSHDCNGTTMELFKLG